MIALPIFVGCSGAWNGGLSSGPDRVEAPTLHFPCLSNTPSIGVFDSGVGGISVLRAIREQMPEELVIYFGDQRHVPYGSRSMEQIQNFSEAITRFLLGQGAKIIVVACNTASAAALNYLREKFWMSHLGMELAVSFRRNIRSRQGRRAATATFQVLCTSVVERSQRRGVIRTLVLACAADRAG
jgi:hypothetical protein